MSFCVSVEASSWSHCDIILAKQLALQTGALFLSPWSLTLYLGTYYLFDAIVGIGTVPRLTLLRSDEAGDLIWSQIALYNRAGGGRSGAWALSPRTGMEKLSAGRSACLINSGWIYAVWLGRRTKCFHTCLFSFPWAKTPSIICSIETLNPQREHFFFHVQKMIQKNQKKKQNPLSFSWGTALRDCGLGENTGIPQSKLLMVTWTRTKWKMSTDTSFYFP